MLLHLLLSFFTSTIPLQTPLSGPLCKTQFSILSFSSKPALLRVGNSCFPGGQPARPALCPPCWGTQESTAHLTSCWPYSDLARCQSRADVRAAGWAITSQGACWALIFICHCQRNNFKLRPSRFFTNFSRQNFHIAHLDLAWSKEEIK